MRIGIVGAGLQAARRAPVLLDFPDSDLVVISAAHFDSAKRLADRLGCEAAEGWQAVVERPDIDAVIVATPPHLHAAISIAALKKGKHVLCEKPLARTAREAQAMITAAKAAGVNLKCGFNHRHHPGIQKVQEWLQGGLIGRPLFARCRYGIGGRPGFEKEWRADRQVVSGGQLMEQGIHGIDLGRWFLGEFQEVTAFIGNSYWPTAPLEDNAFAMFQTPGGQVFSIHASLTQWKNLFSFELFGEDGYACVEGLGGSYGTERAILGRRDPGAPFAEEVVEFRGPDPSWREEWREFVQAVGKGSEPLGGGRDGLEALRLVFAAYEAARTGTRVSLR